MTKNNMNEPNVAPINKPMAEMDDIEFITYADYLSSPYYCAYIEAKTRAMAQAKSLANASSEYSDAKDNGRYEKKDNSKAVKSVNEGKLYAKKRGIVLVVIAVLMLVVIAAAALGAVGIVSVDEFVAAYIIPGASVGNINISIIDPVLGTIKALAKVNFDSNFYETFLASQPANASIMTKVATYAVPAAALLIIIFALIGFIKAIIAIFAKKTLSGKVKKHGFGLISIVMFLSALIMVVGGIYLANIDIAKALDFITQKGSVLYVGYGLYALIAIPVITFILSFMGYKKIK